MIKNKEVIVVDYKSGELMTDQYTRQLQTYMNELKRCGYQQVTGYIWYTKTNQRVMI
jgi:CRISPR/Cas system-associated exonuclease Cas4 (RecB family)